MKRNEDPLFSLMSGYLKVIFIPPHFQDMGPSCLRSTHLCVLWDYDFKSVTRSLKIAPKQFWPVYSKDTISRALRVTRTCWALDVKLVMFTNIYCNFN